MSPSLKSRSALITWLAHRWYDCVFWSSFTFFTLGWRIRIAGRQNIPSDGPLLLLSNHQSFFDPVLIGLSCNRYLTYLARKTLFKSRFFAFLIQSLDAIPIDHQGLGKEGLQLVGNAIQQGKAVLIFPEGERTGDGEIHPLKPGISLLIKRIEATIVPIGIAGAFASWPRFRKFPVPAPIFCIPWAGTLAIHIGKPIPLQELRTLSREDQLKYLENKMRECWIEAEKLRRK